MEHEHFDVLIVGAGLSGIGAAYRLRTECPGRSFAILEGRSAIGGTWDLFRYPGIRSDSDMFTLGYPFRPWAESVSIAEGSAIRDYIRETASAYEIDRAVRYGQRVVSASWSSDTGRWTLEVRYDDRVCRYTCAFLYLCTGYYSYGGGYLPDFPGRDRFAGTVIHPQDWPADFDWSGRKIVVVGSGATAVTLVPALSERAARVTLLQRSPSYVSALPQRDPMVDALRRLVPTRQLAVGIRWRNILLGTMFYQFCRRCPERARALLNRTTGTQLEGSGIAVNPHFSPRYAPWDQRMCLAPDGDLFAALRSGRAEIVTDRIATFTETGIALESGRHLDADVIVTATGLNVVAAGEIAFTVDGEARSMGDRMVYRGMLFTGMPNLAWCVGYTNASWTLRADLVSRYVCRLLNRMDADGFDFAVPVAAADEYADAPFLGLTSGYVQRAGGVLPKQGRHAPWLLRQNYLLDFFTMRFGRLDEGIEFGRRRSANIVEPV
ncbi:flavin-containing monooxygenase [Nocardia sp. NPDC004722]